MKRFQDLLSDNLQNQYGLHYSPIKNPSKKNQINQNQKSSPNTDTRETVEIYLKSTNKKSAKIKVQKCTQLLKLKTIIETKVNIPPEEQIIYLNGRQITPYYSITFNQFQILHVSSRKSVVNQNQTISVHALISVPNSVPFNNQKFRFQFQGKTQLHQLLSSIQQKTTICNPQNTFSLTFLQSGRILQKNKTFTELNLSKQCHIICLLSQNFVETKFTNQFSNVFPTKNIISQQNSYDQIKCKESGQQIQKPNKSAQLFSFKKNPINSKNFMVDQPKKGIYTRIQRKSDVPSYSSDYIKPNMNKRKSESDTLSSGFSGFKKKKNHQEDYQIQDSCLITKIVVRKSKQQVQKILSQNSLLHDNINEEDQNKSVVSSSSSQKGKEYVPVRQQKQYRPCPLIPQRKMPQSQKIRINHQLQKLFGLQHKNFPTLSTQNSNNGTHQESNNESDTTKPRTIMRNENMRGSITAKQSMLKMLKDRKPDRYAEQRMYQGD